MKAVIAAHGDHSHSGGWAFPTKPFGWTSYVFYGGDLRDHEAHWLLDQLREVANTTLSDEPGGGMRGFFLASHDAIGATEWRLQDGKLLTFPVEEWSE